MAGYRIVSFAFSGPLRRLKPVYEGGFREDPWVVEKLVLGRETVMAD